MIETQKRDWEMYSSLGNSSTSTISTSGYFTIATSENSGSSKGSKRVRTALETLPFINSLNNPTYNGDYSPHGGDRELVVVGSYV